MKRFLKYNIVVALVASLIVTTTSCDDEETFNPEFSVINSTNEDVTGPSQGFPNDLIIAEGVQLDKMKSIGFATADDTVEVVFNPVLNSSVAVMFNVPWKEDLGSKMGNQNIVFTNKNGVEVTQPFEILQPEPVIRIFEPARPKAGETTVINGLWFQGLEDVTFDGESVEYEQLSSTEILMHVPEKAEPAEVVVTTNIGSVSAHLDVDIGYNVYLVNDFDGGGLYPINDWWSNGDMSIIPAKFSDVDGYSGNYVEITWDGSTANGWGNAEPSSGANPGIAETNTADVIFVCEAYCVQSEGAALEIQIDDGITVWALSHQFTADEVGKWVTLEFSTYDFVSGYGGGSASHDMGLQDISKIKLAIPNWTGVAPTVIRVDNMRFHGYY
ncbi:hypothetical protein [Carboxylicivirga sp. RSCT41]|uniref:hypothetical protein n=1 Tax=Carboxylicivirga agarovorans TaxID=3417570 RepID=UPI003D347D03